MAAAASPYKGPGLKITPYIECFQEWSKGSCRSSIFGDPLSNLKFHERGR